MKKTQKPKGRAKLQFFELGKGGIFHCGKFGHRCRTKKKKKNKERLSLSRVCPKREGLSEIIQRECRFIVSKLTFKAIIRCRDKDW